MVCCCSVIVIFEGQCGEGWFCWVVVVWVGFYGDYVVWVEFGDMEWVGVDWVEVGFGVFGCVGVKVFGELCGLEDWGLVVYEWVIGVWFWCVEGYFYGQVVDYVD